MKTGNKRPSNVKEETPPKGKIPPRAPGRGSAGKPGGGDNDTINALMTDMSGQKGGQANATAIKLARQKIDRARRTFGMSKSVTIKGVQKTMPG